MWCTLILSNVSYPISFCFYWLQCTKLILSVTCNSKMLQRAMRSRGQENLEAYPRTTQSLTKECPGQVEGGWFYHQNIPQVLQGECSIRWKREKREKESWFIHSTDIPFIHCQPTNIYRAPSVFQNLGLEQWMRQTRSCLHEADILVECEQGIQ